MKKCKMAVMLMALAVSVLSVWGFGSKVQAEEGNSTGQIELTYQDGVLQFRDLTEEELAHHVTHVSFNGVPGFYAGCYVDVINSETGSRTRCLVLKKDFFDEKTGMYCVPIDSLRLAEGTYTISVVMLRFDDRPEGGDSAPGPTSLYKSLDVKIEAEATSGSDAAPDDDGDSSGYEDTYIDMVAMAENGATVELKNVTAISNDIMRALQEKGDVTLRMEYTYEGVDYVIIIPAGKAVVTADIPWYGPLWLAQHYGNSAASKKVVPSYTIQPGDTFSKLARNNGMTVAELAAKNPQISDINMIRAGQSLNLQ